MNKFVAGCTVSFFFLSFSHPPAAPPLCWSLSARARSVAESSLSKRAVVLQEFVNDPVVLEVHVYLALEYTGQPWTQPSRVGSSGDN